MLYQNLDPLFVPVGEQCWFFVSHLLLCVEQPVQRVLEMLLNSASLFVAGFCCSSSPTLLVDSRISWLPSEEEFGGPPSN